MSPARITLLINERIMSVSSFAHQAKNFRDSDDEVNRKRRRRIRVYFLLADFRVMLIFQYQFHVADQTRFPLIHHRIHK